MIRAAIGRLLDAIVDRLGDRLDIRLTQLTDLGGEDE